MLNRSRGDKILITRTDFFNMTGLFWYSQTKNEHNNTFK